MWLGVIEADRLRNLRAVNLKPSSGLTVIAGRNGQGKTSLLEAVYLLGTGRSFRTRKLDELIRWNEGPLRVAGTVQSLRGRTRLAVVIDGGVRKLLVERGEKDLESFIGRLDVVDLNAERMKVLRGGPEERRRFLDRGVVGLEPSFLRALGEYRRVLQQRNALLRTSGHGGASREAELEAWDARLVPAASRLHRARREYAVRLGTMLGEIVREVFPEFGELSLHYRPSPSEAGEVDATEFSTLYQTALVRRRKRDFMLRHTCSGPHRDDLKVELEAVDLRRFGSAGQVRAAMIALKLAKLSLLRQDRGEAPVFLMDDFDSDLDEARASALARYLQEGGFQALVATSKEEMADRLGISFMKVRMDNGEAHVT